MTTNFPGIIQVLLNKILKQLEEFSKLHGPTPSLIEEDFEDTKRVIGISKSKKDRQHNVSKDTYKI